MLSVEDIGIILYTIIIATIDSIGGGGGGDDGGSRNVASLPELPTVTMSLYCNQQI